MRTVLNATGRVLVTVGLLILLFVVYQLWGTGILQARAQDSLRDEFRSTLDAQASTTTTGPPTTTLPSASIGTRPTPTSAAPPVPAPVIPPSGEPVASIEIPKIGVSQVVVEGVDIADLRKGPGHYPRTPLPGQLGNASIAGHRTTYGAPFGDLDQLVEGDEILVETVQGRFTYRVFGEPFVVSPDDGDVLTTMLDPSRPDLVRPTLTLTTCNPKYSAAERLIVHAALVLPEGEVAFPALDVTTSPAGLKIDGLDGDTPSRAPALLWAIIVGIIGLAWWLLFRRYPRWYVWFAGAVPFLAALFVFYTYLERLLPANY